MISASLFQTILLCWIGVAAGVFILLQFITAPYGRHTKTNWGPMISNRLGWIIMESPTLWLFPTLVLVGPAEKGITEWILVGCYLAHYIHRTLIFPFRIRTKGKKMPLMIVGSAVFFNLMNAGALGFWFGWVNTGYGENWLVSPQFLAGAILFLTGAFINIQSDTILLNLRKGGEKGYKIPFGGLFTWISCPNHFGEMIEWIGFGLMCWNLPALAFVIWTAANLLPRAVDHHKWYLEKFPDYPRKRKAVIPFIW